MRVSPQLAVCCALFCFGITQLCIAQAPERIASTAGSRAAAAPPKFTFILFWKEDNPATASFAQSLQTAIAARADRAELTSVNVNDPASRAVVERFQVDRAPMPIVLCVAPNGAVTGVIARKFSEEAVDRAIVSPVTADAAKAIQEKKLVVVHVMQRPNTPLPAGAAAFITDPEFQARTVALNLIAGDPQEEGFLSDMKIVPADVEGSLIVLLAPPGALVGKFPATATGEQIAAALHAAGKCCDDPNCKHNQRAN
jgi:hypothetical protein